VTTRYTLYTAKRSGAASVEVLLGALKLDVELRDATPWSEPPGPYFDELKRVNPLGQLPTLVTPSGEVLT
jgi:GST-like protein